MDSSNRSSTSARDDALAVLARLRDAGHEAYFAGGCVRDELLGLAPKDFDVATDARPPRVRELFKKTQAVGAAFGVILVRQGLSVVEVATFRSDGAYTDGRRPEAVVFTTAAADAQRRDFTINGLLLDPLQNRIIDHVGGQADLAAKLVRAIGNPHERFAEDYLRMLRAVRFASRLGFDIEPATAAAIADQAHALPRISPERIADELRRMLMPPTRSAAARWLEKLGLLEILMRLFPENMSGGASAGSTNLLSALEVPATGPVSFGLALAALALSFPIDAESSQTLLRRLQPQSVRMLTAAMRKTLRISNDEESAMAGALAFGPLLQGDPTVAAMKRFLARPHSEDARLLMAAVARCNIVAAHLDDLLSRLATLAQSDFAPPPLITGDDLTAAGAPPGPAFKLALDAAYDAQLEGRIHNREAALQLAISRLTEHAQPRQNHASALPPKPPGNG